MITYIVALQNMCNGTCKILAYKMKMTSAPPFPLGLIITV